MGDPQTAAPLAPPERRAAERGLRRTRQRTAVLDMLARCPDFVSAQELHALMAASGSTVGLTTVYRTLRELERAGLVDVVRDECGERLYLQRPTDEHSHYLICRCCGRSQAVDADVVERWADRLGRTTGFAALQHTLELSGVCGRCQAAEDPTPCRQAVTRDNSAVTTHAQQPRATAAPGPEWVLRAAEPTDVEPIAELRATVMRPDLERLGRFDEHRVRQRLRDSFSPHTSVIVADGAFAGCVTLRPAEDAQWLEHFYLDPALQGRGLGSAVLRRLLHRTDADGDLVRLNVLQGSAARRLYERHGFTVENEDPIDVYMVRRPAGAGKLAHAQDPEMVHRRDHSAD